MKLRTTTTVILLSTAVIQMAVAQTTISQFDFNSSPPDNSTSTGTLSPAVGTGTITTIGGTSSRYYSGSPDDPAEAGGDNSGLSLASWASPETGNGLAGLQVAASTVGFSDITLSLDFRQSSTASRYFQLQVSADGTTFQNVSGGTTSIGTIGSGNSGTTFTSAGLYSNISASGDFVESIRYALPAGSVYENNPDFAFRWVAVFDPANGTNYTASDSSSDYGTTGTGRFDMVSILGNSITVVPEPTAIAVLGLSLAGWLSTRLFRRRNL